MSAIPSQLDLLHRLLDAAEVRHRVIGNNIANVNTPGFTRSKVNFEIELAQAIKEQQSTEALEPTIERDLSLPARGDGNNVDIDIEMGDLNKNALLYQTYTQLLVSKFGMLKTAVSR